MNISKNDYLISDRTRDIQRQQTQALLKSSYWAAERSSQRFNRPSAIAPAFSSFTSSKLALPESSVMKPPWPVLPISLSPKSTEAKKWSAG